MCAHLRTCHRVCVTLEGRQLYYVDSQVWHQVTSSTTPARDDVFEKANQDTYISGMVVLRRLRQEDRKKKPAWPTQYPVSKKQREIGWGDETKAGAFRLVDADYKQV